MVGGKTYKMTGKFKANGLTQDNTHFFLGNDLGSEIAFANLGNGSFDWKTYEFNWTCTATGTYRIGIMALSPGEYWADDILAFELP